MWTYGIDVSNWQGSIDWTQVNADPTIAFVYMLVSDGTFRGRPSGASLSVEAAYTVNKMRCKKPRGGYHFARPHNTDAIRMAEAFVRDCGEGCELTPCLDVEEYAELSPFSLNFVADWVGHWCSRVQELDGRVPVIYCGAFFKRSGLHRIFPQYPWWLPQYTANSTTNPNPVIMKTADVNGPRAWDVWQYTSHGRVNGINGNVDMNVATALAFSQLTSTETSKAPTEEDEEMLVIYWSKPGCTWVRDVFGLDNSIEQGFAVEGRFCRYIGEKARPGHEGWDERTTATRNLLAVQGFPDGQREAGNIDNNIFRTLTLLPDVITNEAVLNPSATSLTDADVTRIVKAVINEIAS